MADEPRPTEYRTGSDARTLRAALGCFATGVTVVTCVDPGGRPVGFTANSFTSVSLDPPLLLVCVHKQTTCAPALIVASHFAVNVLQTGQQPASIRFATRDEDRFGATPWSEGEFGPPILKDSLGVFECERFEVHEGGDHDIIVGRVLKASFDASLDPLLYFRGSYRRLHFD
jgi:flavin reductase (DIM6/NTAB) family NADH-FMN oxidoreductase RutF